MNTPTLIVIGVLAVSSIAAGSAAATSPPPAHRTFVIGMAPSYETNDGEKVLRELLAFVLEGASNGDQVLVYDARNLQPVVRLTIPDGAQYERNARARIQRLRGEIVTLQHYFAKLPTPGSGKNGFLLVPQFLDLVRSQLRQSNQPVAVVLVGAPFYHDAEMAFDFGPEGAYPSDGFLGLPASESPFSTVGRTHLMEGIAVHWAFLSESHWSNDAHRQGVLRFWSLFVQTQAGVMASAAADVKTVFQRAADGVATPLYTAAIDPDAKAEMIIPRHRREGPREAIQTTGTANGPEHVLSAVPNWLEDKSVAKPKTPAPRWAQTKIGLRWDDGDAQAHAIDLDLYVQPNPLAKEISYRRTRTAEGWLWKDWLASPAVANGFETVELNGETDLTQLRVAVNFYKGHHATGSVPATVRIWLNGEVFEAQIRLPASDGNQGAAADQRRYDSHWAVIDVPALVGLSR